VIRDMTPQPYPLGCSTDDQTRYLVLGWTPEGNPVVVQDSPPDRTHLHHPVPKVLTEAVRYYLPT